MPRRPLLGLLLGALGFCGGSAAMAAAPSCFQADFRAGVRAAVSGYAGIAGVPGVSLGVVHGKALVHADGVGHADKGQLRRATADTPYYIASLTKLFTATLALQLAAEKRLDLDAPVTDYLPATVRVPTAASGTAITARHLLTHTAGLPKNPPNRRNQEVKGPVDPGVWEAYEIADLYEALGSTRLMATPGSVWRYSNYGYALLGHVLERVAGQPYEVALQARLLAPLGMEATRISLSDVQSRQLAAFYWDEDESRQEQAVRARFGSVAGFIGLTSTVRDLARFLMAHGGRGVAGRAVLDPAVARRMAEARLPLPADEQGPGVSMALGWFRQEAAAGNSGPLLWHHGEVDGHASALLLQPQTGLGVIVLLNLGGETGSTAAAQISRWLLRRAAAELARCPR